MSGNAKAKDSTKHGSHHWLMQRVTALCNIPLVVWFVITTLGAINADQNIIALLSSPVNAVLFVLLFVSILYHGALGMRVILEDYVSCNVGRPILILLVNLVSLVLGVAVVVSIIYAHLGKADLEDDSFKKKQHEYRSEIEQNISLSKGFEVGDKPLENNN